MDRPRLHRYVRVTPRRQRLVPRLTDAASLRAWECRNPAAWTVEAGTLVLRTAGSPSGPIRKPGEWAILKSDPFGDVTVSLQIRSDAPVERKGRDLLVFFGWQSPTRFYYAHLCAETSGPHNGLFLVNDADRRRIDDGKALPRLTDRAWHTVRLVRRTGDGSVAVYVDDLRAPLLTAMDRTLLTGRVGVGSFDDTGAFKQIVVEGDRFDKSFEQRSYINEAR